MFRMVELVELTAGYDGKEIVKNVSATFKNFEISVLVGPNGSGKSTLTESIIGLNRKHSGKILIDGADSDTLSLRERALKVAYMAQLRPVSNISVERLVLHGRFPHLSYPRKYGKRDYAAVDSALTAVHGEELRGKNVQYLSGGERQRAYIAMALAQETPNIFMDEPTNFLDVCYQAELKKLARKLADGGKAVCVVMHDLCAALEIADKLLVLDGGELRSCASAEETFSSGVLEEVFHVRIGKVETENGTRYYYD